MGWKYDDVKKYIETDINEGYTLISKQYEGIHKKIIIKCESSHVFEMSFGNLKDHGYRCPDCEEIKRKKNRFELFKSALEEENYKPLFKWEDCKTKKTKLKTICPNDHIYETTYDCFIRGKRCKKCNAIKSSENQRRPLNEIIENIEAHGFKIIKWIDEYKNKYSKFIVSCNNGHKFETSYGNLLASNFGCSICSGVAKNDGEYVRQCFIDRGLIPLFSREDYINANSNLPYICPHHKKEGIQYKSYSNLKKGDQCKYCANEKRALSSKMDEEYVFNFMKNKNMIPLDGEKYVDNHTHIHYICEIHKEKGIQTTTWMNLNDGKGCKYCAYDNIKGEKHYNYKGGITPLQNLIRDSIMKSTWKYESSHIYHNRCAISGLYQDINVHHKNKNFSEILIEALNILKLPIYNEIGEYSDLELVNIKNKTLELHYFYGLGIPLTKSIHVFYHSEYGRLNNNDVQFEEFKQRYYNGEFDNELEEKLKSYNSIKRLKENGIEINLKEAI